MDSKMAGHITDPRQHTAATGSEGESAVPPNLDNLTPEALRHLAQNLLQQQCELTQHNQKLQLENQALAAKQSHYAHLYDLAPSAYLTLNSQGIILEANHAAGTLLGVGRDRLRGRPLLQFITPEDTDVYRIHCQELFNHNGPQICELRLRSDSVPTFWARLETALIQLETGAALVSRVVISDISELKQTEEALRIALTKYAVLFDTFPLGITISGQNGQIIETNSTAERLLGIPLLKHVQRKIDGKEWRIIRTDGSPMPVHEYAGVRALQENRPIENVRMGIIKGENDVTWINVTAAPLPLDGYGVVIAYGDITALKEAEDALHANQRKISSIFRAAPVGIGLVINRVFQEVNDTLCQMLGYTRQELLGQSTRLIYPSDEDYDYVGQEKYRQISEFGIGTVETRFRAKDGRILHVVLSSTPLDAHDHSQGTTFTALDISQRKEAEDALCHSHKLLTKTLAELREAQNTLVQQERLAAVGQLAAGIAHDFNNIMAVILLYAELITQTGQVSDRDKDRLATIVQQVKHAAHLTEQILDFGRRSMIKLDQVDLASLLGSHVDLMRRTLPENIQVSWHCSPGHYLIQADRTRIQQAVTNLSLNARDALLPQGGELRISLDAITIEPGTSPLLPEMSPGPWVRLSVADNGTGIRPEALPHIFEPFFTTKETGQGSGLGLPQVHGIIGQHKGRIDVDTRVNVGTTFYIYLPALPAVVPQPKPDVEPSADLPYGRGQTILIVEDNDNLRAALITSLQSLHYQVEAVANGQEALDTLNQPDHSVALILSDVIMPNMGGLDLLRALRQQGNHIPLILLTGHAMHSDITDLKRQGVKDILFKPPEILSLAQALAKAFAD